MTARHTVDSITSDDLDQLYDQLAALRQVARGYCPHCGRGDAAPTVTDWEQQKQRADQAEAEIARLRAGEEPGWTPAAHPTPGQWIALFNQASPQERFDAARWAIGDAQRATTCFYANHEGEIAEQHQALALLTRARDEVARWRMNTLEPQTARALDDIHRALVEAADEPARTTANNPATS